MLKTQLHNDEIYTVDSVLTEEECDSLYKINEDMPWKLAGTRYSGYNTKIRKCKKRSNITFPYYDRLIRAVNLYNDRSYKFHLHQDRKWHEINMVRYDEKGMFFRPHGDHRPNLQAISAKTVRKISLSIQLSHSEEYGGGDLKIVESYTVPDVFMDSNFLPETMKIRENFRHSFPTMRKKGSLTIFTSIHEHES